MERRGTGCRRPKERVWWLRIAELLLPGGARVRFFSREGLSVGNDSEAALK